MRVTNKYNLPQPFCDAVAYDDYDKGESDFSTTGLLRPVRIVALQRKHWQHLEEDASERVWRLSGQAKHVVLERIGKMNPERYLVEERFYIVLDWFKIGGRIDLYDRETKILYDWKETSIWKVMLGNSLDWEQQGNINCLLLRTNGVKVERLINIVLLKDWKTRQAEHKKDYPESAIQSCPLPIWPEEKTIQFLRERIVAHQDVIKNPDKPLPLCTPEERWRKESRWALMREGHKRAIKLFDDKEEARNAIGTSKDRYIEPRPGEDTRCLYYCPCNKYCSYYRELIQDKVAL